MTKFRTIVVRSLTPFGLGLILATGVSVSAWTAAPANPPASNVAAPINVSSLAQTKTGTLTVGALDATGISSWAGGYITTDLQIGSGNLILPATTATVGAIMQGGSSFIHSYGASNTFVGINSGNFTMTGTTNTATGYLALTSNTTGDENTANGSSALTSNTTGYSNTANGSRALTSNTEGYNNTANGSLALTSNTTGYSNTADGYRALYYNTTGYSNTADGYSALTSNTTGYSNTADGSLALASNTTGNSNTVDGYKALYANTIGIWNTAIGRESLVDNINGGYNVAVGPYALAKNTGGDNNTAVGYAALDGNITGDGNVAVGIDALYLNTTGYNNTAIGNGAGPMLAGGALYKSTAIGYNATYTANNTMALGGTGVDAVSVVIGKTAATAGMTLDVNGQVQATAFLYSSDRNLKENIEPLPLEVSRKILGLSAISFDWKATGAPSIGVIAQDVEALYPDLVATDKVTGIKSVNYAGLTPLLLEVVKGQDAAIRELRLEVNALKAAR